MSRVQFGRWIAAVAVTAGLLVLGLATLGAGPSQEGVPPQPYGANFFSGTVSVEGSPAPEGTQLIGCVDDCGAVFQSDPVTVNPGGGYSFLLVNPGDEALVGRTVTYHLVNEFGRITASETNRFEGDFNIYEVDLTFDEPIPTFIAPPVIVEVPASVQLTPQTGVATTVTGSGFNPNSSVTVSALGSTLGEAQTDRTGSFRLVITAPSLEVGDYEISTSDDTGRTAAALLSVPNLSGAPGAAGTAGADGSSGIPGKPGTSGPVGSAGLSGPTGPAGQDGLPGAAGLNGKDSSAWLEITAIILVGLAVLGVIAAYMYLSRQFKELARRLPPPGIR